MTRHPVQQSVTRWAVGRLLMLAAGVLVATNVSAGEGLRVSTKEGAVLVWDADRLIATYTYDDSESPRPYFENVFAPNGTKATRNHPPQSGDDRDHVFHSGIFFSFGDLNGLDFWHPGDNKSEHVRFVEPPRATGGVIAFVVENRYVTGGGDKALCSERTRHRILSTDDGYQFEYDVTLRADKETCIVGSKEEGGLAIRVATPIAVVSKKGGRMVDSEGRINGRQIWGKRADWVDYSGPVDGQHVGVMLMAYPDNSRPSWWHARDYGLFAANPFGPLNDSKTRTVLRPGESLRLRYAALFHAHQNAKDFDPRQAYANFLQHLAGRDATQTDE